MIDEPVIGRVLGVALRTGGDFAEVFAEDRRGTAARLDDGRVEDLASGRERGAGIRVVVGRDHRLRPHRATCPRPGCAARPRRPPPRPAGRGRRARGRPAAGCRRPPPNDVIQSCPRRWPRPPRWTLLRRADEAARGAGGAIRQVSAVYGDSRRRILVANSEGVLASDDQVKTRFAVSLRGQRRHRHADRPGVGRRHRRLRAVRPLRRRGAGPAAASAGRSTKLAARPAPSGTLPGGDQAGQRRRALPRGVRPRPRGRPHRQGRRRSSPGGSASWWPARWSPWSTTAPWAPSGGRSPSTTRAIRPGATSSSRTACSPTTCGTGCGPARRAGPSSRQRPAGELPAPADGAHDQHLRRSTAPRTPTRSSARRRTGSTSPSSAAARSTPPPATSCSA